MRVYQRKTNRQSWSEEKMMAAVIAVVSGELGARKAAAQYNLPKATIERRVRLYRKGYEAAAAEKGLGSRKTIFSVAQEEELVLYLQEMEKRLFGLTKADLRRLAFELAERNCIPHPFKNGSAGPDWVDSFLRRHPALSLRKPEATSGARAMGFNRPVVYNFFDIYEDLIARYSISPDRIYNCDETGVSICPKSHSKIISTKGKRQVGVLTSAERGQTVTVEICLSATGAFMPLMFVFPRTRMKKELIEHTPPGTWGECHSSGWMQSSIYTNWFKEFVNFSHASKEKPVLLLLDGHATHVKNLELIDLARENGVVILNFPPHCTHKLQPSDVGFMRSLSINYSNEVRVWLRSHPGRVVTQYQVAPLLGNAFIKSATMSNALSSFRATGIWPMNRFIFTDDDFLPSAATDRVEPPIAAEVSVATPSNSLPSPFNLSSQFILSTTIATCSDVPPTEAGVATPNNLVPSPFSISPEAIIPIPLGGRNSVKPKTGRKRGKAAIITESPYKRELEEQQKNSALKQAPKKKLFQSKLKNKISKTKATNYSSTEEEDEPQPLDSSDSWEEEDYAGPKGLGLLPKKDGFAVVVIHGEKANLSRNYVAKITSVRNSGLDVLFLKKFPKSYRFEATTEAAFIPQSDIVEILPSAVEHSAGRFRGTLTFTNIDFAQYSIYA